MFKCKCGNTVLYKIISDSNILFECSKCNKIYIINELKNV